MPVRLTTVLPTLQCGGTETQVMLLTRSLDRAAFDIDFACLRRTGPLIEELDQRGVPVTEYAIPSLASARAAIQQMNFARDLSRRRVDIVHSYNFYGNAFAVLPARLARVAVVVASIRDRGPYLTPLQKRAQRAVCRLADRMLVNAMAVKDWLVGDGYDPARIAVIPNGIDLSRFQRPHDPAWLHRELKLPPASPLVAVVSRIVRLKGLEQFVEAAAVVAHRCPEVRFLIVGEPNPSQRELLAELAERAVRLNIRDRVVFTGRRADVPAILASVTVSVIPSLDEALSNALLESMAAGAPIVATRVGGTPEATSDREHGLLVPAGDVRALADGISTLLEDRALAARLGRSARERIAARYSVERMTEATEQLYRELLDRKRRSHR
ncbi:MAG: glycosyltransferase [Acidobacteria bacterium]|nr:MAG: glycosyltransferase [Acidobacteriota bacterium]